MRIVFNGLNSGLANNGGSRTILKSVEVLRNLGHTVEVAAHVDNFTWFAHKAPITNLNDFDAVINIAAVDYLTTQKLNIPTKVCWWRAHETWNTPEEDLIKYYLDSKTENLVNSIGLQVLLLKYGAKSDILYQGIDFDQWNNRNLRAKNKIRIGCLHTKQPRKRWKDFVEIAKILGTEKYEYVGMGGAIPSDTSFLTTFIHNANVEQLNNLYSSCHIWFCPTESEGLHNVGLEAALCGCLIVCSDHPLNGMILDYANKDTAMVYDFGNLEMAVDIIKNPNWNLVYNMNWWIREYIGSREDNMKKLMVILGEGK